MIDKKFKVSIIGASGYTGSELMRLLEKHPNFEISEITAHSLAGKTVSEAYPHLFYLKDKVFKSFNEAKEKIDSSDVVFLALPHGESMKVFSEFSAEISSNLIVDLGSDFRLKDSSLYQKWYGKPHLLPDELSHWTYGMSELFSENIKKAKKISNPGCYPTASSLALAPLYKADLLVGSAQIDAYSGISGAGKVPSSKTHFSHLDENIAAYKVTSHQHTPEIEQCLEMYSGKKITVSFVPHLAPMVRGIHVTASSQVKEGTTQKNLEDALKSVYANSNFVNVLESNLDGHISPQTKSVRGSNYVNISVYLDKRTGRAITVSVIDNLVKGASGQAIQNANIALGLPEETGLTFSGLYP